MNWTVTYMTLQIKYNLWMTSKVESRLWNLYHFISSESIMINSLMPSLNSRSFPFVVFLGRFPSRCQNLSSGAIRPGGLLYVNWTVTYMTLQKLNITFGWLQKLNPGYEICIISYQVNLSSEVSAMFNSLMPSLNIRSLPFCGIFGWISKQMPKSK